MVSVRVAVMTGLKGEGVGVGVGVVHSFWEVEDVIFGWQAAFLQLRMIGEGDLAA